MPSPARSKELTREIYLSDRRVHVALSEWSEARIGGYEGPEHKARYEREAALNAQLRRRHQAGLLAACRRRRASEQSTRAGRA